MKRKVQYEQPKVEILKLDAESVICGSVVYGEDGYAGRGYYDIDDIVDAGDF